MVEGIIKFKEYFKEYSESYIIIGGTACDIVTEGAGFDPRATVDIDIVLIVEALDGAFVSRFWEFIKEAGYQKKEKDEEKKCCYRFKDRKNEAFPKQIELFSRRPDVFTEEQLKHLTPIPVEEGLSYLSAILLNEDYYRFTIEHSLIRDGIHYANTEALICLKAFAYLNNKKRKEGGQAVREKEILKHKYDVFRMVFLLNPEARFDIPDHIKRDLQLFADTVRNKLPPRNNFKVNGYGEEDMNRIYQQFLVNFNLKES